MEVSLGQETLITLSNMDTRKDQRCLAVLQVLKRTPESMIILVAIFRLKSSLLIQQAMKQWFLELMVLQAYS